MQAESGVEVGGLSDLPRLLLLRCRAVVTACDTGALRPRIEERLATLHGGKDDMQRPATPDGVHGEASIIFWRISAFLGLGVNVALSVREPTCNWFTAL